MKPFGENVEGFSHCGDERYNVKVLFNTTRIMAIVS